MTRRRIALAFSAALALVLVAVGAAVYVRFEAELRRTVDRGLNARAAAPGPPRGGTEEQFSQALSARGEVLAATPGFARPLLTAAQVAEARAAPRFSETEAAGPEDEPARLLAVAAPAGGATVVGAALDDQREALATLLTLGGAGLAVAWLLASAGGWWAAGLAVELGRLERTRAAEREALARERRFVADASHELRTPLAALRAEVDVALARERPAAELRAALASTAEEALRLTRLTDDLLVLARADEGALALESAPHDAGALLRDVAGGRAVRAPEGLVVHGDVLRLRQALGNLVVNAAAHGGDPIELFAEREGEGIRLGVRDGGPGFPPEFLDRAFERFSRPDGGRSAGGTGLGLAIVAAIARAHGGTTWAVNRAPGAEVGIALPSSSAHPSPTD